MSIEVRQCRAQQARDFADDLAEVHRARHDVLPSAESEDAFDQILAARRGAQDFVDVRDYAPATSFLR